MGDILGMGLTHYPSLIAPDEERAFPLTRILKTNDRIPPALKEPRSWPEPMRHEYGDDQGLTAARQHRERLVRGFRKLRAELDDFQPDFVLIWGDDQYENFREDIIPPFCILCYDRMDCKPFTNRDGSSRRNVWGEPANKMFTYQGQPQAARLGPRVAGSWHRHGLRLQTATRNRGTGTRLPQHAAVSGLRPPGV